MGKPILYCSDCGRSLREEDFDRGRAGHQDNRPFCVECRPSVRPATGAPPPKAVVPERTPSGGHRRLRSRAGAPGVPVALAAAGGGLLMILLVAGLAGSGRKPGPPSAANAPGPAAAAPERPVEPPAPAPRPPPVPIPAAATSPAAAPEPPPPPRDPAQDLERWLADVRKIRANDPEFRRAGEVRSLLRMASEIAGPRKAEIDAILAAYEKELAMPVVAAPAPAPTLATAPAPAPAPKPTGKITGFTLVNAETEKPVPGYDPMPADSTVDLAKLGLKKIDIRINTSPASIGPVETQLGSSKPRVEQSAPYSFTTNSAAGGFTGWTPAPGRHTLKCRPVGGAWTTFTFTVADAPK